GVFFGLNLTHDRADMFRAVVEGIAAGTAHVLETYAEAGASPAQVMAVGGGTRNALWLQATSDFAGVAQQVCAKTVGASYGNAFLAATAIGAAKPDDIARWNPNASTITPETVPAYALQYPLWKRLYAQTRDIMRDLP
ncbi:MAG: carbohydrate kinase, partial [Rhodobacteraceae bacterium]|nr:carbohydrate kinase [Paracoccaceae bacterium]